MKLTPSFCRGIAAAALLSIASFAALADRDGDDHEANRDDGYAIGLWGDLPYSDLQAQVGVPNLIADMNRQQLAFTVHDGDLKAGNGTPGSLTPTTCSDELYTQALGYFNALRAPAMLTPGDNDWTDCDRPSNGGFNSRERLDHERQVFFSTTFSLGQKNAPGSSDRGPVPERCRRSDAVRREPPLDVWARDLRDAQRAGVVQQPVRHGA